MPIANAMAMKSSKSRRRSKISILFTNDGGFPSRLASSRWPMPAATRAAFTTPHLPGGPNADLALVLGPAGRIHMKPADLITYLAAHRDGARLLRPATWQVLHTPHFDGEYALGWNLWPDGSFTPDGSNLLWYAIASFNPRTGPAAAAAANDGRPSVGSDVGQAVRQARVSAAS